jgi:hypothetical protein
MTTHELMTRAGAVGSTYDKLGRYISGGPATEGSEVSDGVHGQHCQRRWGRQQKRAAGGLWEVI